MRKLASIQTINKIVPIEGADSIELVGILGWQCVSKKNEFHIGDKCVYFEVDAYLPIDNRFEFLRGSSYRNNEFMGEGFRIKTMKFRGCISQGLALPVSVFPELPDDIEIGTDVSDILKVRKWEMPEIEGSAGTQKGNKPYGIPTTDETRVQSLDVLRQQLLGKPYYISTKMDGTSCTFYVYDGQFGVCGRNYEYKDDDKCAFWKWAHTHNLPEKMTVLCQELGVNLAFQGEYCGAGIQKNRLRLLNPEWFMFNVINIDTLELFALDAMLAIADKINVLTVPIEERGEYFDYTLDELLEKARGKYPSGLDKEGIVVRPIVPFYCKELGKGLSFKVLNNDFLAKEK